MQSLSLRPIVSQPRPAGFAGSSHPVSAAPKRVARRFHISKALIGDVNDPEKVKQDKKKKENESIWAEPKNDNPLENRQPTHSPEVGEAAEKAQDAVGGAVEKAKQAVKDATNN